MPTHYDLICVGSSFASTFFLHSYLNQAPKNARVLVLERGERRSHTQLIQARWQLRSEGSRTFTNATREKPWWYAPTFGGTSNMWFGNTPRMLPEDFRLYSTYQKGSDWPLTYQDLEPFYLQAETLMQISGSDREGPFPRSGSYPLSAHQLSEPERWMEKAQPSHFFPCPTARASTSVPGQRAGCCTSFVCNFCPVNAKFTVQNGFPTLYLDPRIELKLGTNVQALHLEGGEVSGVEYVEQGHEKVAQGDQIALGANAIFNPYILLNSGIQHPALGRYLHEQVGRMANIHLKEGQAFGGSTSCTGLNFRLAHGAHRRRRGAVLLETHSKPSIRIESGRWRNLMRVTGVFEDLPQKSNRVTVDKTHKRPRTHFKSISSYAQGALDEFEKDLETLLEGLPVEKIHLRGARKTEGHIMGTARMGSDPETSVVDQFQRLHQHQNVFVLGGSSFPTGPVANPSLTISALSLRSATQST